MKLPVQYEERMKALLGEEYREYEKSLEEPCHLGLRVNTRKWSADRFLETGLFVDERVPWTSNGFYLKPGEKPAKHPYYFAGLYYLQEPSAMAPAATLPVEPGDRVLDLCAAPGGKSTELAARLKGQGFLVANDLSRSRAKALLKNLELFGIENMAVVSEEPGKLSERFPGAFDKILVDAPCSGEGMFRREPSMTESWKKKGPADYAPIQRGILKAAVKLLKPGGMLLYSTCTFSLEEDEENVRWLLEEEPSMELSPIEKKGGMEPGLLGLTECARLWPHKLRGEGHFLALFRKKKDDTAGQDFPSPGIERFLGSRKKTVAEAMAGEELWRLVGRDFSGWYAYEKGTFVYAIPEQAVLEEGLSYLRTGLLLGERKKGRFEPFQAFAMSLKPSEFENWVDFSAGDVRAVKYLKGETIDCQGARISGGDGWCLVCVDGFPLGFAKRKGMGLKNKYHAGWRWQ